jgi:hypothetical protein
VKVDAGDKRVHEKGAKKNKVQIYIENERFL